MLGKIQRFTSLFKTYKGHSFQLILNPILGKEIWIEINGRKIWINYDKATYYHLINSVEKVHNIVKAIPADTTGAIIDGGANHGLFSVFAAKEFPDNQIIAVEPYPGVLPFLRKNIKGLNVELEEKALAGSDGEISFFSSPSSDQLGSTHEDNVQSFLKKGDIIKSETVEATSLKSLIKKHKISNVGVLKLDVQGAEYDIIKEADDVLSITDFLIIEVMLIEDTAMDVLEKAKSHFPYHKIINQVSYGADIIFSKKTLD